MHVYEWQPSDMKSRNPSLVALYAFIPPLILILFCAYQWHADIQADKTAKTTVGVITHDRSRDYEYEYEVNGTEYTGEEIVKTRGEMVEGQPVEVTYRPEEPATSTLTPPFGANDGRPVPMVLLGLAGIYFYFRLRHYLLKRQSESPYDTR